MKIKVHNYVVEPFNVTCNQIMVIASRPILFHGTPELCHGIFFMVNECICRLLEIMH